MSWLSRKPARIGAAAAVAVAAGAVVGTALAHNGRPATPPLSKLERSALASAKNPEIDPGSPLSGARAPGFTLVDQNGRRTSLAQFRGKVVALAFVDARCTTICPVTTQSMAGALGLLGPLASRVQLIGIDANPLAHAVSDVRAYTVAHRMQGQWRFLAGPLPALKKVWHDYHVYVAAIQNNIDHEPIIMLIDGQGRERTVYITQMSYAGLQQQAQLLANGMAALMPGHPRPRQVVPLSLRKPAGPAQELRLPVIGGAGSGTVQVGAGHPHLVVFFATWLSENGNVRAQLEGLDAYARLARQRGWPTPVAVDVSPTEPDPGAVSALMAQLHGRISYPVVADRSGQLADGYGAQDMPWFDLVSAAGHVVMHNDGWFPPAALAAAVAKVES